MKFSIRDLLLVTVIVALAAGWWVDHRKRLADAIHLQEGWNATKKELTIAKHRAVIEKNMAGKRPGEVIASLQYLGDGRGAYRMPNSSVPVPNRPKP